ncbi:hypothetical protein [Dysgonomonas sp. HGC4]|uniref:hypothetical protein n=1 Tax=Dysgonomonas sp. HGC4 TaxID=1658009 RepID=UPI00068076FE|nr:hypothetical protein [Dysgonomonas sp. HGC4]MBD8348558.1 hypothetical protein [Dysgonomonas sp. HGC4]
MSTKSQNIHGRFYGLLNQMKGAEKDALVWQYSNMLTTSLPEFLEKNPRGYAQMIKGMEQTVSEMTLQVERVEKKAYIADRELKKRRSAILLRLQKAGINTTDWQAVNKFMRNPKIAGKTLGEMSTDEMDLLIPKLEAILAKDKLEREKLIRLAQAN